eukprot:9482870-Pyramimonas_sp.AAC.1
MHRVIGVHIRAFLFHLPQGAPVAARQGARCGHILHRCIDRLRGRQSFIHHGGRWRKIER